MRYLFILILFASCTGNSGLQLKLTGQVDNYKVKEQIDTLKIRPYKVKSRPAIFETAFFTNATAITEDTIKTSFYTVNIGKLKVETGELVAWDPNQLEDAKPFIHKFPSGSYPVHLSIAKTKLDQRVAFARVYFSANPVSKWQFALRKGQENKPVFSDSIYGYGADAGIGLFMDMGSVKAYNKQIKEEPDLFEKIFFQDMDKHYQHTWSYTLYNLGKHNLAAFYTGYGDGFYATFIGYDQQGKICRLLTDFSLVEWRKDQ